MITLEMARAWYPSDDPVHGYEHILRVYRLAEKLSRAESADWEIVAAAVLLHDVPETTIKSLVPEDSETRRNHHHRAAIFAAQILSSQEWETERIQSVQHCIRSHRFRNPDEQPQSLEAQVLFDADKLDAIGAIGVARAIAYAVQAGQPIYTPPSDEFVKHGRKQSGEAHSAFHEYVFKLRKIQSRLYTPTGRQWAQGRHDLMKEFFERLEAEYQGNI